MRLPLNKTIVTQNFGDRPEYYAQFGFKGHEGVDFQTRGIGNSFWANLMGWQPCYAVADGTCLVVYGHKQYGTYIDLTDNKGNLFRYCHLKNAQPPSPTSVIVGPDLRFNVKAGDRIGITGSSGNVTGPHLHFMYRPANFDVNNGYLGFENPIKLFNNKFVMKYTCFNTDSALMEQARQLMLKYSGGLVDISFAYQSVQEIVVDGLFTSDMQYYFNQTHPVNTPFVFVRYVSRDTPNYDYMATAEVPMSKTIMTASEGGSDAFGVCYEMTHAIQMYVRQKGYQITIDDINTPDEAFLMKKLNLVLDIIKNGGVL